MQDDNTQPDPGTVFKPQDNTNDNSGDQTAPASDAGMPGSDPVMPPTDAPADPPADDSSSDTPLMPPAADEPSGGMNHDEVHGSGSMDTPPADPPAPDPAPPADPPAPDAGSDSPAPPPPPSDTPDPAAPTEGQFTWQAAEYVEHQRPTLWYVGLALGGIGLIALMIFVVKAWLSAVVLGLMMAALIVYAHKTPRQLQYQVGQTGLDVGGKFYPYGTFRSFALVTVGTTLNLELDPIKRFMPRLSIMVDKPQADRATAILGKHLPQEDRQADLMDSLSHALKF